MKAALLGRRFIDLYEQIVADLGGQDAISEGQRQLARRAAMLSAASEGMEDVAVGNPDQFDIERFGMICDRIGRLFQRLGLERRPRDVSPTLASIVARHRDATP